MGSISLAAKLADELGTSVTKTRRLVDDVGDDTARALLDDVQRKGNRVLPDDWWKPVAVTGAGGAGALAWNQQKVWQAQAAADKADNYNQAVKEIIGSDLPNDIKLQLAKGASNAASGGGGGNDDDGSRGLIPDDIGTTLVLMIVLVIVLVYALESVGQGALPRPGGY